MKLTITATDKPKEQEFHYELEISNKQVITTTICTTLIICSAIWTKASFKSTIAVSHL
ncbi:hypothetical protein ACVRXS_02675 [Streptococcus orisratti]|uniref:hypothetical protein n=1 Tax=Streptococcus TaxID=1301 RepID=UPI0003799A84|nr:hypothetical protein [Streptococcus orisratti]MDY5635451.1 hypothetical protein [Streptococcus orisratti]